MSERVKVTTKKPEAKKSKPVQARRSKFNSPVGSPIGHILHLQRTIGNQAVQRMMKSGAIQAKLKIGQPNDIYEQEADRVAEQVMRMPEPRLQRQAEEKEEEEELIQTKPLAEQITPLVQRQVEEEKILQIKEAPGQTPEVTPELESCIHALKGGGQPLPESIHSFFEPRFGYGFSKVRVHADGNSENIAEALNARAFTVGRDIVFVTGQYSPGTNAGKRLLAHELAHVVQQTGLELPLNSKSPIPRCLHIEETVQRQAKEKERCPIREITPMTVVSLEDKDLELCTKTVYSQEKGLTPNLELLIHELTFRTKNNAEKLPDEELENKTEAAFSKLLRLTALTPQYFIQSLYFKVLLEVSSNRFIKSFPTPKLKEFKENVVENLPEELKEKSTCLDVVYYALEILYPGKQKEIDKIAQEIRFRRVLKEGRPPTEAPKRKGLLTKTMKRLEKPEYGMAGKAIRINYPSNRRRDRLWLANQLRIRLKEIVPDRSGDYFFVLSLHRDYHSVTLWVKRQERGKSIKIYWIDQFGKIDVTAVDALKEEVLPNPYPDVPGWSTIWPLIPKGRFT